MSGTVHVSVCPQETSVAVQRLSDAVCCQASQFSFAGMKDRRAVTVQHMVVRGVTADRSVCVCVCVRVCVVCVWCVCGVCVCGVCVCVCVCVCVGCATSRLLPSHQAAVCCPDVWRGEGGGGRSSAKVWGLQLRGGPSSHGGPLGQPVLHPCTRDKGEHGNHVSHTSSPSTPWHMNQLLPSNPWWPFVCTQPAVAMARGVVLEWTDAH